MSPLALTASLPSKYGLTVNTTKLSHLAHNYGLNYSKPMLTVLLSVTIPDLRIYLNSSYEDTEILINNL